MNNKKYQVIQDPVYGYKRLDPLPSENDLSDFYQNRYYELIRDGGRAPEIRRLLAGGEEKANELKWLRATLYSDILYIIKCYAPGKRLLDVGCGLGELICYLEENGVETAGTELSSEAVALAQSRGLIIYNFGLNKFVQYHKLESINNFDIITFINVLEHVPNPVEIIKLAKNILKPAGIICNGIVLNDGR